MARKTLTVLFITLVINLGGFSPLTAAQSSHLSFDMSEVRWKSLSFKSDNFFGTVTTKAVLEEVSVDGINATLIASPQGVVLKPGGTKVLVVTINSTIEPLIGPDELLSTKVWFTPQDAAALQRIRLRKGKEKWEKTYRWTADGVYRLNVKPKGAEEEELPIERWTDIESAFYPYDPAQSKCGFVTEPAALLYFVSAAGLAVGDPPLHLCVFNKKQLHRVRVRAEKHQLLKINYLEKSQHKETQRNGTAEVLKLSFTSRSLFADEAKAEPFTFLGLMGDYDIFIDKVSKIPVQVSGQIPGIGRVDIKLREISPWQGSR